VDSKEEEEEEEEIRRKSGTAHRRYHVATPWASHRLVLGQGGMWEDKKVPRRPRLQTHVVTPCTATQRVLPHCQYTSVLVK